MLDHPSGLSAENDIALQKFGVGQPVRRKEDDTLVRGKGTYTDDVNLPGQAYAWIVRSSHAHGVIKSIDIEAAKAMPGVLGVWTGKDLAGYAPFSVGLPLKNRDGSPLASPVRPVASSRVAARCQARYIRCCATIARIEVEPDQTRRNDQCADDEQQHQQHQPLMRDENIGLARASVAGSLRPGDEGCHG